MAKAGNGRAAASSVMRSGSDPEGPDLVRLGNRIREARNAAGLTTRALAKQCGISQPFLSQMENGQASPSLTTLFALSATLGMPTEALLADDWTVEVELVRANEGPRFRVTEADAAAQRRILASNRQPFTASEYVVEPGADLGGFHASPGVDLIFVVEGQLEIELAAGAGDEPGATTTYRLEPGDTLHYPTTTRHRWRQLGDVRTRFVHVVSAAG